MHVVLISAHGSGVTNDAFYVSCGYDWASTTIDVGAVVIGVFECAVELP